MGFLLLLAGCKSDSWPIYDPEKPETVDPTLGLTRKDYDTMLHASQDPNISFKTKGAEGPPIPDLAPILASPEPPKIGQTKLVSLTVTDDVPLKDVLLELARLADIDIEVDANISGGISFRAKDRPFNEVIDRIANLAGLRYKMKDGVLRVERDTPYIEVYPLDFINIDRTSSSNISLNTSVLSATGGGGGLTSGSTASVTANSTSDFWSKFDEGIKQILAYTPSSKLSAIAGAPAAPAAGGGDNGKTFYIINRQGATLTVSATDRQHEMIKHFLKQIQMSVSSQVLIEAKIVEVTLDKEFQSGIDWTKIGGSKINFSSAFNGTGQTSASNAAIFNITEALHPLNIKHPVDLNLAVQLAEKFGTTRTLSSPRLHAMNNQQAVLTFAQNQVFFQITVSQSTTTTVGAQTTQSPLTVNSTIKTVPIGIILSLQPSINLETDEVTLDIRPTLSRVVGSVEDPAVAFLIAQAQASSPTTNLSGISSTVPVVEVRELDSILKLKSGQVMVIGGLMQDLNNQTDTGLPFVNTIPVVGQLFNGTNRTNTVQELVIFIRATILDTNGDATNADKGLYKKFTDDPRPLDF